MKKRFLVIPLLAAISFTACSSEDIEFEPIIVEEGEADTVSYSIAGYGNVISEATLYSKFTSTESVDVRFGIDNKLIKEVNVKKGDYVEKGDLIAKADVDDAKETVDSLSYEVEKLNLKIAQTKETMEFELEEAKIYFEGYTRQTKDDKKAYEKKRDSLTESYEIQLQSLNDTLNLTNKRLLKAKEDYNKGYIYSPISGQITYLKGSVVDTYSEEDTVIATISNSDKSYFTLTDLTYMDYITEDSILPISYRVNYVLIETTVKPVLMDRWVEDNAMYFSLVEGADVDFGTDGKIIVELARRENVLSVPTKAVHTSDKGPFVYIMNEGTLQMQYVTVGVQGDSTTEITDGLKEGDRVAIKK